MKSRLIWIVVVVGALAGFYYATIRPMLQPTAPRGLGRHVNSEFRPADIPMPPLPEPKFETPVIPLPSPIFVAAPRDTRKPLAPPTVPIQDGATIDFSIGAPSVRSIGDDKTALDKALKEMAEATKDIEFPPSVPEKK
ncbi:MAG: hypothetical protein V4773_17665 [Verrucomicrobiota bacterium]